MKKQRANTPGSRPQAARKAKARPRTTEQARPHHSSVRAHRSKPQRNAALLREQAALLQLTHDSITVMDLNHTITFWNHGAEEHYGWCESEALGQVAHTLLRTLFPQPLDEIRAQLIHTGRWEGELEHTRRDGTRIIVTSRWVLQRNSKGEPIAILETNTDSTERKRAEDRIRELNAELDERVAERTAKLETANEQLEELNTQLEEEIAERRQAEEQILKLNRELEQRAQDLETANEELKVANEELRVANENLQKEMVERKRAEDALHVSEERFRFALANSPVIVGNLDRKLRYTWIYNPVSDLKPEDVVGKTVGMATDPGTQDKILNLLQDVVANGTSVQWETATHTSAGDKLFESHAEPLKDAKGEIIGVAMVSIDITERKRTEDEIRQLNQILQQRAQALENANEELQVANEELRVANEDLGREIDVREQAEQALRRQSELLQLSFDAIIVWRLDSGIESWNHGAAELYGFTEEEALGRSTHELLQTTHPVPWHEIEAELRSKGNWEGELRHYAKDGRQVIVSARHQIVRGADGVARVLETNRDITERRRAEQALRDSRTRFQALVETTSDFIWEMDARGVYTYCSPRLETLWGLDPKEMVGKSPFDLLFPEDREQVRRAFSELAASKKGFRNLQVRSCDAKGAVKSLEISGVPFFDAAGELKGFRGITRDITERKQMELEIQDAAAKYSTLFDTTSDGIWIHNLNGEIVEVNDAYCRMSGYPRDELTHMPISTLEAIESPEEIAQHIQKLLKEGGHDRFESRHRRKDGSIFDVDITALYLEREGGRIAIFARDITKRKQAEAALRRRTAELQAVMEAVPTAVFITRDPDSRTISGNRAARELVELPPSANISKSAPEAERPTGWQEMRNGLPLAPEDLPLQQAARGQEVQDYEMDLVFQDGTVKSVLGNATPLRDENGNPQGGIAVLADVTQRKRAEEALKRQDKVLTGINRIFQQAIACETDEELGRACLTVVEDVTASKFGFIGELNANGKLDDVAISDPGWDACQMPVSFAENRRVPIGFEVHGLYGRVILDGNGFYANDPASHPDSIGIPEGHPPLNAFLGVPLLQNGKIIGMIAVGNREGGYRDEDLEAAQALAPTIVQALQRKRAEESLQAAMQRIQHLNEDLEQRAGELQVANEELEQLATSLTLDLRAPLVSLRSVSRLIAQDYGAQLAPQAQRLFHLIEANAEEMEQLTQGLDQLMRVTRQTMRKQKVVPEEIVQAALAELEPERAGRQVEIAVGPLPACRGDPLLLKHVWLNLLSNALKFTRPREQTRIEIGARPEGDRIVYFVKDNGVGFDMSYAGTIFHAFQRYHHAEEWGGAGVGLAMVESIVRRHGGRVWAEGFVNEGATFYFTLG